MQLTMAEVLSDPRTSKDKEIQNGDLARMVREGREEEVVEYLASADRNDQQWQRELDECVVMAIQHKQAGIMKHLVEAEAGYDINSTDSLSRTPLHLAAQCGNIAGLRVLMEHGADLFARDGRGYYPWTYAIERKHDAMKELLHRVDPDEHQEMFESLLHMACRLGSEPAVRYLLDRGLNVNCTDNRNRTPLSHAVEAESIDLVQCIINHNLCDVNANSGVAIRSAFSTSVDDFTEVDNKYVFYVSHGNSYRTEEEYFCNVSEPIIRCLIQAGASLNLPHENGRTLLMLRDGELCKVKRYRDILLQHGADVNAVARDSCSVLWMAINYASHSLKENQPFAAVKDLLAQNIDVGVTQHQYKGRTPLQAAFDQRDHALCNLLLDADCSLYRMNDYLSTIQVLKLTQDMEEVRARILVMCDKPYSLKAQARLAVLRAIGQGDLRENLHRIHRSGLLPKALVNYLGKAIKFNI